MDSDEELATKPRRRQLDEDGDYTQTLLNSLTLEQIREAVYRLAPTRRIPLRAHAESLEALFETGATSQDIQATLLDVERTYPFKHCLLLHLDIPNNISEIPESGKNYRSGDLEFKLSHISQSPVLSLTFEHIVEFKEWVQVDKDNRTRRTVVTRQPIIVRAQPDRYLLTLSYPGFTHSNLPGSISKGYEQVVESLLRVLKSEFGWLLRTLPIKNALKYFVEGSNRRVLQVKADVDTPLARFDVSAKGQSTNIEEAMASFISAHLPGVERDALVTASKKAFSSAIANSIVLYWLQEGLFTRLRFWDIGTELHFVWNNESATYRVVDEITYTLSEASQTLTKAGLETGGPLSWIAKKEPLVLIHPGDVSQQFSLMPGEARSTLLTAMKAGLVEPVYRFATSEMLVEIKNDWSADLSEFKREVITDSGIKIDGNDPENLEVAFRRVALIKGGAQ
ncbi:hypothetical protein ABE501_08420 [Comamonas testosteroni]